MLTTNGDKNRKLVFLEIGLRIYCSFDLYKFKSWVKNRQTFIKKGKIFPFMFSVLYFQFPF